MKVNKEQVENLKSTLEFLTKFTINKDDNNSDILALKHIISELEPVATGDKILISWSIEDVKSNAEEEDNLTDKEARSVLSDLYENHDACLGINWDTIESSTQHIIDERD